MDAETRLDPPPPPPPAAEPQANPDLQARAPARSILPSVALVVAATGFGLWFQAEHVQRLEGRLASLETSEQTSVAHQQVARQRLETLRHEIAALSESVADSQAEVRARRALEARFSEAETRLGSIGATVEATASSLGALENRVGSESLDTVLNERDTRLQERWEQLSRLVQTENEALQRELDERIAKPRNLESMWQELLGPVVQLAGETSVGSGVLLRSEPHGAGFRTYLLTAWHVVRDIQGSPTQRDKPVPVTIYGEDGSLRHEEASLIVYDADLDAALLEIASSEALPFGAMLASRKHLESTRIFDRVYAVGCPLGNDPIPTYGEVATRNHVVDGETYWMINAPTYIGNSGGGIFDSETHELLGIFSKIYTHGSLRPTIVPHMGLATPLSAIYDWLDESGYAAVHAKAGEGTARMASAQK